MLSYTKKPWSCSFAPPLYPLQGGEGGEKVDPYLFIYLFLEGPDAFEVVLIFFFLFCSPL